MNTAYKLDKTKGRPQDQRIVYVRPIDLEELPSHVRAQAGGMSKIYGVFGPNGEQIAFTPNRATAFDLARENALTPLSVH